MGGAWLNEAHTQMDARTASDQPRNVARWVCVVAAVALVVTMLNVGKIYLRWEVLTGFLIVLFAPSVIAIARRHRSFPALFALNLLLGWTVIGWIVAMVWATANEKPGRA